MNIVVYKKDSDEHVSTLWEGIGRILPELARTDVPVVLAVTGAGGKTTCIAALARELMDRGKRVLVVTTTHMYQSERYGVLTDDAAAIVRQMRETGIAVAGLPCDGGKISYIGDAAYHTAARHADVVLVEADGSRRLPFKVPGANEPVLPARCDAVLSIAGLSALGRSLQAVCFRWNEAADAARRFGRTFPQEAADGTVPLSISLFARLWQNCCLSGMAWDIPVLPVLNQADTPQHRIAASLIFQEMDLPAGLITSFAGKEGIPCI
ncbi:selenium cofactor biosynthesis protein YqeC [uncultured Megasphaera sp.]|uniref:selenium cofactor biosynthesis protein YqeC n=1 Tax=uncultured Megasphaera sp. TaxID=165188 RepID=UPI0026355754|nr:selenium cofactor biosynthesis protein YqeC [uncultured Megasphaera sp.]